MSKNVLILMMSPRKNGNTRKLADEFAKAAEENGNTVKMYCASDLNVAPCIHCDYCRRSEGACSQKDDMTGIYESFEKADVVVLASPLYFHSVSAQLKTVIDRLYAAGSYKGFNYDEKESLLLMTCMDSKEDIFDQAESYYNTLLRKAFPWKSLGIVCVSGLTAERDSIVGHPLMKKASEIGNKI